MDLRGEHVPRDADVGGVYGAVNQADHRGRDSVLDAGGYEPNQEVHAERDGWQQLVSDR